ncbi:hypothetical protein [Mesorhizobium sp. CAU 1732]|uniref:hypothetical protein n=1 Tax=Mesorhizobium sp. CAU 1732 TaxID=3140358 RepID=UPI0032609F99
MAQGRAIYEQLGYPGTIYRVTRLTMVNGPYSYEIYGAWFPEAQVLHVARQVPPASRELNGVKATAGIAVFVPSTEETDGRGIIYPHVWYLRIDEPGDSLMQIGEVYATSGLGRETVLDHSGTEFQEHAALVAYSSEPPARAFA